MGQLLDSITLEGFRQFDALTLDGLGPVNLLFGDNNSGKTTILEALTILSDPLNQLVWLQASQRQLVRRAPLLFRPTLEPLRWLFCQTGLLTYSEDSYRGLKITTTGTARIKQVSAKLKEVEEVVADTLRETSPGYGSAPQEIPLSETNSLRSGIELSIEVMVDPIQQPLELLSGLEEGIIAKRMEFWENKSTRIEPNAQRVSLRCVAVPSANMADRLTISLSQARREGFKAEVIELIQLVDPDIEDLEILDYPQALQEVYVTHRAFREPVPIYTFGDGLKRILSFALNIPRARDGLLLIDEIETAIHASLLDKTFAWLVNSCKAMNVQLFATTHSLEAMDAILNATPSVQDVVGYGLRDNGRRVQRYSEDVLSRIRNERGLDPR